MEFILKSLSPQLLLMFLPMLLIKLGNWFKGKDADNVGSDDAFGNVLIAAAPAVEAFESGSENAKRKALTAVRDTINNYLNATPSPSDKVPSL